MEVDCYGTDFLLLKSPEVNRRQTFKLLDPYASSSSSPSPEPIRQQMSGGRENAFTESLLSTPIKMETEDDVFIIDGIPVQEPSSGSGSEMLKSSGSCNFSTESNSTVSMSSGSGSSGSGNGKSKMSVNRTRFGRRDYSPCKLPRDEEELLSGIQDIHILSLTETPAPSLSNTGASSALTQFATSYRPYVPSSVAYPFLPHQMLMRPATILHQPPYEARPNTKEPANVIFRTPNEKNGYVTVATAPIKMKQLPVPIARKPAYEQFKVKAPTEPITIPVYAVSTPDITKAKPKAPPIPPGFSYWDKSHPASEFLKGRPIDKPINIQASSECGSDAAMIIPKGPTAAQPISDWWPQDDGIQVTLPGNNTPSRKEVDDHINRVLYGTNSKKRLPVFEKMY